MKGIKGNERAINVALVDSFRSIQGVEVENLNVYDIEQLKGIRNILKANISKNNAYYNGLILDIERILEDYKINCKDK